MIPQSDRVIIGRKAMAARWTRNNVRQVDTLIKRGVIKVQKFGRLIVADIEASERAMTGGAE